MNHFGFVILDPIHRSGDDMLIESLVSEAIEVAKRLDSVVSFRFNARNVTVAETSVVSKIVKRYFEGLNDEHQ